MTHGPHVPGCDHLHGLTLDAAHGVGFIACDGNATVHTMDLDTYQTSNPQPVGADPDVLVYDRAPHGWPSPPKAAMSPC